MNGGVALTYADLKRHALDCIGRMPFSSLDEVAAFLRTDDVSYLAELIGGCIRDMFIHEARVPSQGGMPVARYCLTPRGASAVDDRRLPISAKWRRDIARRMSSVKLFYHLCRLANERYGGGCEVVWRSSGWLDASLMVPGVGGLRMMRIGSTVARRAILSRLGSMVNSWRGGGVSVVLIVLPGLSEMRLVERWLRENAPAMLAFCVVEGEALRAERIEDLLVNRPSGRSFFLVTLERAMRELEVSDNREGLSLDRYRPVSDVGRRVFGEREAAVLTEISFGLSANALRLLRFVSDWHLCDRTFCEVGLSMAEGSFWRALRELVNHDLVYSAKLERRGSRKVSGGGRAWTVADYLGDVWEKNANGDDVKVVDGSASRLMVTGRGWRFLSWADRSNFGGLRRRWGVAMRGRNFTDPRIGVKAWEFIGGKITTVARQMRHQDGLLEIAGMMYELAAGDAGVSVVELLPTHRSERWAKHGDGRSRGVFPDVSGVLEVDGHQLPFFVEYERRAIAPAKIEGRLRPYRRYYDAMWRYEEWGRSLALLVVYEEELDASGFLSYGLGRRGISRSPVGRYVPIFVSSLDEMRREGIGGKCWSALGRGERKSGFRDMVG